MLIMLRGERGLSGTTSAKKSPGFRRGHFLQASACESASSIDRSPNRPNPLIRNQFLEIGGGPDWTPMAPEEIQEFYRHFNRLHPN
jgi:hypothetical protein